MEYFDNCCLNDLEELQRISQTAYLEAFYDLLNNDDVKEYVKSKYCLDNLKKEFEDISNYFLFFYIDDKAVGYMKYILKPSSLEIDRLYMLKSCKGKGIGTKFMNKAEDIAKLNGKKALTLGVLEMNKPAISFYEKKGFTQYFSETVAIGKNEYHLLLMKREL
jgi:GNAT superfamily N-acetyltransferase